MRVLVVTALACAVAAGVAAQQSRQPPKPKPPPPAASVSRRPEPQREAVVPFAVGETLLFDVSWSQFLTAGTATVRVAEKKPSYSSTAFYIVAEGKPVPVVARFYPLLYRMETLLDSVTTLSQWTSLYTEENTRKRLATMRFDRAVRRAYYERPAEPAARTDFAVPANVQDGLATLYALRARNFSVGERFTIPIVDDGALFTVQFETGAPEQVDVGLGQFKAWNLKMSIVDTGREPVGKNIAVWISTDARRLPVKMQAELPLGSFVLALREAR